MRSVVQNKVEEFLEILRWDKTKWKDFWRAYRNKYGPIIPEYERIHSVDETLLEEVLDNFERRELDRLRRSWMEKSKEHKMRCAETLSSRDDLLDLHREDFVLFIMGLLGLSDWTAVRGNKEWVVVVDVVSLWRKGILERLSDVALQAVNRFREGKTRGDFVEPFDYLTEKLEKILKENTERDKKLLNVCEMLRREISYYDWVGFYLVDPQKDKELILGPFSGEPTEHVRIPFGRGICGQAAERETTFVVQDVTKETNYLSCSPKVKSEIVVPIFKDGKVIGELDIDSHKEAPFRDEDVKFLEKVCQMVSEIL